MTVSSNVTRHASSVTPEERARLIGQSGRVIWLTGLSGSGKSTIAMEVEKSSGGWVFSYVLDGDNLRHGLCGDLGFSQKDRARISVGWGRLLAYSTTPVRSFCVPS